MKLHLLTDAELYNSQLEILGLRETCLDLGLPIAALDCRIALQEVRGETLRRCSLFRDLPPEDWKG